ncbi:hypothetical protein PLICRDRAFT_108509 [Plicaturopsis crispa FD-325 SS-3]|nr:hypothetical protein PLICRDRAFT_108509 [Plicaturopsis crispa FD-325 SS-3]
MDPFRPPKRPYTKNKYTLISSTSESAHPSVPTTPNSIASSSVPSTQPRLRDYRLTKWQKVDKVLQVIAELEDFAVGDFLQLFFYNRVPGVPDPRSKVHATMVTAFLEGRSNVKMGHVIDLIYKHPQSQPKRESPERLSAFSPSINPTTIYHARPSLSSWALQLVSNAASREIRMLSRNDPQDPTDRTQLRASTNGRRKTDVNVVTWDDLGKFSIPKLIERMSRRAPLSWALTEAMAAPRKKGVVVVRKHRPHPTIQIAALNAFVVSQNRYATGFISMDMAVWLFACKAHIDQKRVMCRFGLGVHDSTIRDALKSLSVSSLEKLRASVKSGTDAGEMRWQIVLDNVQEYCPVREHRVGRQDELKMGTAATAILLEDCAPGAFNLTDHLDRVAKKERLTLTARSLWHDIDWNHSRRVQALHWVRILVHFIPELAFLIPLVSKAFRTAGPHGRPLRLRKTVVQPLGTNAEREVETKGMRSAVLDFEKQMGLDKDSMWNLILLIRGDGASVASLGRVKKYLATDPCDYRAFRGRVPPGPEIWHTRATKLSAIAENHYGPSASSDPSSLSKSASTANQKRPPNLKKPDFYPTSRSMTLFWEARILDIWRIHYDCDDILAHFTRLDMLPTFESLWSIAELLVVRYASQGAHERALHPEEAQAAPVAKHFPIGSPWRGSPRCDGDTAPATSTTPAQPTDHNDAAGFHGDRVLANEILFLQDMGWWIEAAYAVPEGDIGRVWEIMKACIIKFCSTSIWIISFAGGSHSNYVTYLLDMYCFLRYEASKDLSDAVFNNLLVNLTGELGKWIEGDLMQEHYNRWLEDMVKRKGGDFDDAFFRTTLSPNVIHFLRIKEIIESGFDLRARSKTHGSPHLRTEFQLLLRAYREDELHYFKAGRTEGHAAVNTLDVGMGRLLNDRLADFLKQTTAYADIVSDIRQSTAASNMQATTEELSSGIATSSNSPDAPLSTSSATALASDAEAQQSDGESVDYISRAASSIFERSPAPSSIDLFDPAEDEEEAHRILETADDDDLVSGTDHTAWLDEDTGELVMDWDDQVVDESDEEDIFDGDGGDSEVNAWDEELDSGDDISV